MENIVHTIEDLGILRKHVSNFMEEIKSWQAWEATKEPHRDG